MFSNRWAARAATSHWLSPSVSMPTKRCTATCAFRLASRSSILIRIAQRDVPAIRVLVKRRRHLGPVDLDDELHRGLHDEVTGLAQDLSEAGVHREGADLVRVGLPRLAVDPAEQRLDPLLVVWI